eukprot:scaffold66766_cov19-Tisochrysis_lutea.AAC.2
MSRVLIWQVRISSRTAEQADLLTSRRCGIFSITAAAAAAAAAAGTTGIQQCSKWPSRALGNPCMPFALPHATSAARACAPPMCACCCARPHCCCSLHIFRNHLVLPRASLPSDPSHPAPLLLESLVLLAAPETWAQALPPPAASALSAELICHMLRNGLLRLLPQLLMVAIPEGEAPQARTFTEAVVTQLSVRALSTRQAAGCTPQHQDEPCLLSIKTQMRMLMLGKRLLRAHDPLHKRKPEVAGQGISGAPGVQEWQLFFIAVLILGTHWVGKQ